MTRIINEVVNNNIRTAIVGRCHRVSHDHVRFSFVMRGSSAIIPRSRVGTLNNQMFAVPSCGRLSTCVGTYRRLFYSLGPAVMRSRVGTLDMFPLNTTGETNMPMHVTRDRSADGPHRCAGATIGVTLHPFTGMCPARCTTYSRCATR